MRITELRLPVADVEAARFFYAGRLELPLVGRREDAACVEVGATRVWFELGPAVSSHFAINVPPARFDEAKEWIASRAELIEVDGRDEVDFPAWDARALYFLDPAGNVVELIARNRIPASEPLLLGVSEVGLPVADVGDAVSALEKELGLDHFDGNRRTFSALGDDEGLFIVVPVGRRWFPTEEPSGDAPLEVEIQAADRLEVHPPGSRHRIATTLESRAAGD